MSQASWIKVSKVCEGDESREAYARKLTFGPPQFQN